MCCLKRFARTIILGGLLLAYALVAIAQKPEAVVFKKRIAVLTFNDAVASSYRTFGGMSPGSAVSEMIITELAKSGKYRVIERDQIEKLMESKGISNEDIDSKKINDLGKALGAEIGIYGTITEFGSKSGGTGISVPFIDVKVGKSTMVIAVDVRMLDFNTGEIIFAESVRKKRSVPKGDVEVLGVGVESEQQFNETGVGKITRQAIEDIVKSINANSDKVAWQGAVVSVRDGKIYVNCGSLDAVTVGQEFIIYRVEEELIDPQSGVKLGAIETEVGRIKVLDNSIGNGKVSECKALQGHYFQQGDIVRLEKKKKNST